LELEEIKYICPVVKIRPLPRSELKTKFSRISTTGCGKKESGKKEKKSLLL